MTEYTFNYIKLMVFAHATKWKKLQKMYPYDSDLSFILWAIQHADILKGDFYEFEGRMLEVTDKGVRVCIE